MKMQLFESMTYGQGGSALISFSPCRSGETSGARSFFCLARNTTSNCPLDQRLVQLKIRDMDLAPGGNSWLSRLRRPHVGLQDGIFLPALKSLYRAHFTQIWDCQFAIFSLKNSKSLRLSASYVRDLGCTGSAGPSVELCLSGWVVWVASTA